MECKKELVAHFSQAADVDFRDEIDKTRENIAKMLIEYDTYVRDNHKMIIQAAENMTKGTPLSPLKREQNLGEPLERFRYFTDPLFRRTVDSITAFIMTERVKKC